MLANSGTANGLESLYSGNATGINSTLTPTLQAESATPIGYTPAQMASQTTAAEQTAGGGAAGATGGAMLRAARTGNIGCGTARDLRGQPQCEPKTFADQRGDSDRFGRPRSQAADAGAGRIGKPLR